VEGTSKGKRIFFLGEIKGGGGGSEPGVRRKERELSPVQERGESKSLPEGRNQRKARSDPGRKKGAFSSWGKKKRAFFPGGQVPGEKQAFHVRGRKRRVSH